MINNNQELTENIYLLMYLNVHQKPVSSRSLGAIIRPIFDGDDTDLVEHGIYNCIQSLMSYTGTGIPISIPACYQRWVVLATLPPS